MANVVTHNQGVQLKTIGKILGQRSIKTTEVYVEPDKTIISENMAMVEDKLFNRDGTFKIETPAAKREHAKSTAGDYYSSAQVMYLIKKGAS